MILDLVRKPNGGKQNQINEFEIIIGYHWYSLVLLLICMSHLTIDMHVTSHRAAGAAHFGAGIYTHRCHGRAEKAHEVVLWGFDHGLFKSLWFFYFWGMLAAPEVTI